LLCLKLNHWSKELTNRNFDEFIEQQSAHSVVDDIDWGQQLAEWKECLNEFYSSVKGYLNPYLESKKVALDESEITLHEEFIGSYNVTQLAIQLGKNKIQLQPIGTNLIAAKGRVDMIGPRGQIKFVLVPKDSSGPKISVRVWNQGEEPSPEEKTEPVTKWAWKIATPPPRISYIELTPESFQNALMEVVNG